MPSSNGRLVRGVWHPAFLEQLRGIVVLDFYVAQTNLFAVEKAFQNKHFQYVKAGFLRGIQDVMIRRYVPKSLTSGDGVPLSIPFCHYTDDQLKAIFATGELDSKLQVIIYPNKIFKYRGEKVPLGEEEWIQASATIEERIQRADFDKLIARSCKLASEFQVQSADQTIIPEDLRAIFSLRPEEYEPIDPESGDKREYYVFIRAQRASSDETLDPGFKKQIVLGVLMEHPRVREIAEVQSSRPHKFDYSIQMEATSRDVDEILYHMHRWAEENNISFGTRTYEVWRYLSRDATSGIELITMSEVERKFLEELRNVDPAKDIRSLSCSNDQRRRLAELWQKSRISLGGIDNCKRNMGDFYLHLTLFNFNKSGNRNLQQCRVAWHDLTIQVERMCEELLAIVLNIQSSGERTKEIAREIENRIPETSLNENWKDKIRGYPWKIVTRYYDEISGEKGRLPHTRKHADSIFKIRNWVAHGGHETLFRELITLENTEKWSDRLSKVEEETRRLRDVLLELDDEIAERRARRDRNAG
jgi:hypothetical protein